MVTGKVVVMIDDTKLTSVAVVATVVAEVVVALEVYTRTETTVVGKYCVVVVVVPLTTVL
jgi:hypothetical protein